MASREETSGQIRETQKGWFNFPLRLGGHLGSRPPPPRGAGVGVSCCRVVPLCRHRSEAGNSEGACVRRPIFNRPTRDAFQIPKNESNMDIKSRQGIKKACRRCDISVLNTRLHIHYEWEHKSSQFNIYCSANSQQKSFNDTSEVDKVWKASTVSALLSKAMNKSSCADNGTRKQQLPGMNMCKCLITNNQNSTLELALMPLS